jgi:hypothetical protein
VDPQLLLPPGAGLIVEQAQVCDEIVHLTVCCEPAGAHCPKCGTWSEAFHSSYERNLGDLPIAGRQAVIDLQVRRFRCYEAECPRKTFVEQAPVLAERYAHRTRRVRSLLEEIGLSLGGRPGNRHSKRLAIPTSRSTLLRMVRGLPECPMLHQRFWESMNLRSAAERCRASAIGGHAGPVCAVALSGDGRLLASSGEDGAGVLQSAVIGEREPDRQPGSWHSHVWRTLQSPG